MSDLIGSALLFFGGVFIGAVVMSLFAARAYQNGYEDGVDHAALMREKSDRARAS